ncbi:MAG TPA: sigma-70 family RNA polymerase sigma factor [Labilithrix sp.]|nr:sigma-70 family RNA polymerase sigma factor [Labilithrix sp.]
MSALAQPSDVTAALAREAEHARRVAALFDAHYDAIWRTLRRLGIPDADADDAAQRVFVVASRRLDTMEQGHEGRYLYGIAVRVASELRRRAPSRRELMDDATLATIADDAPGPEEVLLENEARDALDAALCGMDDELRAVLVLVEIEGLSVADLAASLEVPPGTAASRLRRAREEFTASARRVRARLEGTKGARR